MQNRALEQARSFGTTKCHICRNLSSYAYSVGSRCVVNLHYTLPSRGSLLSTLLALPPGPGTQKSSPCFFLSHMYTSGICTSCLHRQSASYLVLGIREPKSNDKHKDGKKREQVPQKSEFRVSVLPSQAPLSIFTLLVGARVAHISARP